MRLRLNGIVCLISKQLSHGTELNLWSTAAEYLERRLNFAIQWTLVWSRPHNTPFCGGSGACSSISRDYNGVLSKLRRAGTCVYLSLLNHTGLVSDTHSKITIYHCL